MGSTLPHGSAVLESDETTTTTLRWRRWPLVDDARWSWLPVVGILALGGAVAYLSQSGLFGLAAAAGLAITLWQFFVPVQFEVGPLGIRRSALRRTHLVPWHAVRAYQLRSTGVVLYQCMEPTRLDLLRSLFLPFPADQDEALCALRPHLSHALELPPAGP